MTGSRSGRGGRANGKARTFSLVAVAFVVLLAAGAGWFYFRLNGNISTFDADGLSENRPGAGAAGQNVLVIGSDSRAGDNSRLGGGDGDVGRSDTAFLLHVYGDRKHAIGVSIPRDSLVDIPPCRLPDGSWTREQTRAMFNSAFSVGESPKGNPACTQNTVERLTGLRVDHTVVVDFEGFSRMTSAVGGVQVCVPKDVYQGDLNPNLGFRGDLLFPKGQQNVSGQKALDYVRVRHGIGDGSDIGRIQRQQAFVSGLIKKVRSQGFNPTTLLPLADAATKSMTVDPGLGSPDKLLSFAMSLKGIDLHNIKFVTVPWRYNGNRVDIVHPEADALWASIKADRTIDGKDAGKGSGKGGGKRSGSGDKNDGVAQADAPSGKGVSVSVANGTAVDGLASRATAMLKEHGYAATDAGEAAGDTGAAAQDRSTTVIEFGSGEADHARALAALFPGSYVRGSATPGISVVLGHDYADGPESATPSPSSSGAAGGGLPPDLAKEARSADDDPCANLSYG
ncbi:LCP family protein [Streptomyces sp. UNOC14_S4]|uniref:LCP family protein n=1 Tax=Streptomyces sp. UNOC14_S4 TaxID=2872340 RepID=UPI001E572F73|nr:LCP family protein [Streptomyces sp. UNOC14_S4]MCC3767606.1 LCP family protein [Streptomyces sp. UNOC14_S4]